jgi:hypothetical protein
MNVTSLETAPTPYTLIPYNQYEHGWMCQRLPGPDRMVTDQQKL